MKRLISILLFILLNSEAYTQDYLPIFDSYNVSYNYNWRGIDNRQTLDFKSNFIEYAKKNGLLKDEFEIYEVNPILGSVWNNLHVVDLNNDNKEDVIYSGNSGGEANVVKFFITNNERFELAFTIYQGIVKADWEKREIRRIYTHDWGCCGGFRLKNTVYETNYSEKLPKYEKKYQSIEYEFMRKPREYLTKPIKFMVDNEVYKLRTFPEIDDTTFVNSDFNEKRLGNVIGILSKGAKGKAYGTSTDKTGRIWWYVEIEPESDVKENTLYMKDLKYPTHVIGWISSKYVTVIE